MARTVIAGHGKSIGEDKANISAGAATCVMGGRKGGVGWIEDKNLGRLRADRALENGLDVQMDS